MNYEEMSDFEINKLVADIQPLTYVEYPGEYPSMSESAVHVTRKAFKYGNEEECGVDYCNDPSDAWPIIVENGIGVWTHPTFEPEWSARYNIKDGSRVKYDVYQHKNPLRAAMIVYLMMQEGIV